MHSIRWRLVASYALLALVTVSVTGLLAIEIVRRYARQQELNDLQASAQAIAQQAIPLVWPAARPQELARLVQTTAFIGDVQVRLLDPQGQVLADSGATGSTSEIWWIDSLPGEVVFSRSGSERISLVLVLPSGQGQAWQPTSGLALPLLEDMPPGSSLTIVERFNSPWGSRLRFSSRLSSQALKPDGEVPPEPEQGRSRTVVRQAIGDPQRPLGYVELSAGRDFAAGALTATRRGLLIAGSGATLLAGFLGLGISHRLTSPLRSLRESARRMAAGDLSARSPLRSRDEIGDLAAQFNDMAGRLEQSFAQLASERDTLKRFIADASHELRTPVTALKNFNTLLQGPAAGDAAARSEFLAESQNQIQRLEWITQNLLDLSRLDAGLVALDLAERDLGEIVLSAAAAFETPAAEKSIRLFKVLPDEPVLLRCDAARLELSLSNLLDNAFKYTPAGGEIEIGTGQVEGAIRLWVRDSGAGIHPDDLPHIFERFYRGRDQTVPGSGLGLSLVESFVRAQGGEVRVESQPGQGACFILEWPAGYEGAGSLRV